MIDEPRYSGCRVKRYGPDDVTSRLFSRCPAAQMRIASPSSPIGRAERQRARRGPREVEDADREDEPQRHAAPGEMSGERQHYDHRDIASGCASGVHGTQHIVHARCRRGSASPAMTLALVMALARDRTPRHDTRRARPGPIAARIVGTEEPDDGRARRRREMSGPVSPDTTSAARRSSVISERQSRRRRQLRRAADASTTPRASGSSPGPQVTRTESACSRGCAAASAPKRSGGHRLLGQPAPGFRTTAPPTRSAPRRAAAARGMHECSSAMAPTPTARASAGSCAMTCRAVPDRRLRVHTPAIGSRSASARTRRRGRAPAAARKHRRLQQALKVERDVVARAPQPPTTPRSARRNRRSISIGRTSQRRRDRGLRGARRSTSQSIERRARPRDRRHRGHGVDDVAERAQPDDQQPHPRILLQQVAGRVVLRDRRRSPCARRTPARSRARARSRPCSRCPCSARRAAARVSSGAHGVVVEDDDVVDAAKGGDQLGAAALVEDRPRPRLSAGAPRRRR